MCISIDADSCSFSLGLSIQLTGFIQQDTWLLCLEMCSIKCHWCSGGTCQYSQLYSYTVVETLPFSVFLWKCIKYSAQQIQTSCSNKKFVREVSFTASVQGVKCDCIPNTCSEVTLLPVFVLGSDVGEFENIEHEAQWLLKNLAYVFLEWIQDVNAPCWSCWKVLVGMDLGRAQFQPRGAACCPVIWSKPRFGALSLFLVKYFLEV